MFGQLASGHSFLGAVPPSNEESQGYPFHSTEYSAFTLLLFPQKGGGGFDADASIQVHTSHVITTPWYAAPRSAPDRVAHIVHDPGDGIVLEIDVNTTIRGDRGGRVPGPAKIVMNTVHISGGWSNPLVLTLGLTPLGFSFYFDHG